MGMSWYLHGTSRGDDICKYSEMAVLQEWAAELWEDLPVFLGMEAFSYELPAEKVPALVSELEIMRRYEGLPEWFSVYLDRMLRVARLAMKRGVGIDVE